MTHRRSARPAAFAAIATAAFACLLIGTPVLADDAMSDSPSTEERTAYSDELVSLRVPATWEEQTYAENGITYHVFRSGDALVQVATVPDEQLAVAPDETEAAMEALLGDFETDGATTGEATLVSVSGVPMASYPYVREDDGATLTGFVTMVGGADCLSMVISSFPADAPAETIAAVQGIHESVQPVEGAQGTHVALEEGPAAALFDGDYAPHGGGVVSFVIDDVRYIVPTGDMHVQTAGGSDKDPTVGMSVAVRNTGDETVTPAPLSVEVTGPSGTACDILQLGEDDTIRFAGPTADELGPAEENMAFFEFSYDGPGVYTVALYEPDEGIEDATIFTVEL